MGFLDRRPFDASDPDSRALLEALLATYDRDSAVRELVLAAGLRLADFSWSAPMSQVWPEVLRKAADQGRLRRMIEALARDPGSAAYEVIARLASEPTGDGTQQLVGKQGSVAGGSQHLAYLEQVRRIAPSDPPGLVGREDELSDLTQFCLDPDAGPYAWWQAEAWAGKSALLSTFVLHPPPQVAQRVRIVSFFITARLAAQDTREAFIQVMLEQLAELLGQPLPPVLPEATREAFLLGLVTQAAASCAEEGRRLVLVVDGLDEDRGATVGPDAHSIAGLLPPDPPHGMRVIVAGRPNPPVPDDVSDWHPLRKPKIIRPLEASPYAGDVKRLSRQELRRLLSGSAAEQDMLGLLVAARGGLSARDLAELADIPLWDAEEILHGKAGRTFNRRPSRWAPGVRPEMYLMGHEELQAAAVVYLGEQRLAEYQARLHAWADTWGALGWPSETPEYLLGGYFRFVDDLGDVPRMTRYATDQSRHDRMLDITGGDATAMTEARTTLARISAQNAPDVGAALALACHRDSLVSRNAGVPAALPVVWAALGQLSRAEALAASISEPEGRVKALAQVAGALAAAGQHEQAAAVAAEAKATVRSITGSYWEAKALAQVAGALAAAGQREEATAVADEAMAVTRSISHTDWQADALAEVARALAAAGQHEQAAAVADEAKAVTRSITRPYPRARALAQVAGALAAAGQREEAAAVAAEAKWTVRQITDPDWRADVLAQVAGALAAAGQREEAAAVAAEAMAAAQSITAPAWQATTLMPATEVLAATGQREQAAAVAAEAMAAAQSITDRNWESAEYLTQAAHALIVVGQHQQAAAAAAEAEAAARSITADWQTAEVLVRIAGALGAAGHYMEAAATARSITDPYWQADALAQSAGALAAAGQREQATGVAAEAMAAAQSITDSDWETAEVLARIAGALAAVGHYKEAEAVARSITGPGELAQALTQVAGALAAGGQHDRATATARSITHFYWQADALAQVAAALARAGQHGRATEVAAAAEAAARSITGACWRADALAQVAEALVVAGRYEWAALVAADARAVARSITDAGGRADALAQVVGALVAVGQHEQASEVAAEAEAAARSVTDPDRADALARVAEALTRAGDIDSACRLAAAVCETGTWSVAARPVLLLVPSASTLVIGMLEAQ